MFVVGIESESEWESTPSGGDYLKIPLARLKEGEGDVACFETREEAEAWAKSDEDIDTSVFDLVVLRVR